MQAITFQNQIRTKLTVLFLLFGILPALVIYGFFYFNAGTFERAFREPIRQTAVSIGDTIDRNLFERYGDVQAFGLNSAATDPANWGRPDEKNPLIRAMNGYMTGYGIYKLMVLVDMAGQVLAVNSVDASGKPLNTASVYNADFFGAEWFKAAKAGKFLEGQNGITGTVVGQPQSNTTVGSI